MIDFIKSFFDLKKGSLFLVFTSYLAFNFRTIFLEDSFTLIDITLLILSLIIIEVIFKLISLKNPRVSLIIIGNIFFFLLHFFN